MSDCPEYSRREWFTMSAGVIAAVLIPSFATGARFPQAPIHIHVRRDPGCSCCEKWVGLMRKAGFDVDVEDDPKLDAFNKTMGVPADMRGCHTAYGAGAVFVGHVPIATVKRFLKENPNAKGLVVPGMPAGSPGMESPNPVAYDVIAFNGTKTWVYEHIKA